MTVEEMPLDRLEETLGALRAAARYRHPVTRRRHFAHDPLFRKGFVESILIRRKLIREKKREQARLGEG